MSRLTSSGNRYPMIVYAGEQFVITAEEIFCRNCTWETSIPRGISLISNTPSHLHPQNLQEWGFVSTDPGTYTIELYYRKRCCGKPIIQKEIIEITVK